MDIKTRKLNFIQEILALDNEKIIEKLEIQLKNEKRKEIKYSAHNLLGVITAEEAVEMLKGIEESCETINDEDCE